MYKTLFFKNKILNIYINIITQCHTHYISLIYTCTCICVYRYAIGYCLGWVSAMEYPYVISVSVIYISYLMSRFESMMIPNGNSGNWAQHHATAQAPINAKTDPAEGQLENVLHWQCCAKPFLHFITYHWSPMPITHHRCIQTSCILHL